MQHNRMKSFLISLYVCLVLPGYQAYNPPANLSPTNLATTLATNLTHQTGLQQVPLATTQPSCVATAVPFRPNLPAGTTSISNGHRLQNGFQLSRVGFHGNRTTAGFRGGSQKGGFRPGMKRKLEGEENNGKSLTDLMQPLYCKVCAPCY